MATSLKSLCDKVLGASGFIVPTSYFSSLSPDDTQIAFCANEASDEIREKAPQIVRKAFSVTLTGDTTYPLPSDFLGYVPDTGYTVGRWDPILLPTSAQQWNEWVATNASSGLLVRVRFLAGLMQVIDPDVDSVIQFEYYSSLAWTDSTGATPKEQATEDTDLCLFDRRLMELGIKWRWKKEKGLPDWQIDQSAYLQQLAAWRARDQGARTLWFGDPMFNGCQSSVWASPQANIPAVLLEGGGPLLLEG